MVWPVVSNLSCRASGTEMLPLQLTKNWKKVPLHHCRALKLYDTVPVLLVVPVQQNSLASNSFCLWPMSYRPTTRHKPPSLCTFQSEGMDHGSTKRKQRNRKALRFLGAFLIVPLGLVVFHVIPTSVLLRIVPDEDFKVNDHPAMEYAPGSTTRQSMALNETLAQHFDLNLKITKIRVLNATKRTDMKTSSPLNNSTVTKGQGYFVEIPPDEITPEDLALHGTALDEQGRSGYVYDPTTIRRNFLQHPERFPSWRKSVCKQSSPGFGEESIMGYQGLRRVQISLIFFNFSFMF